MTPTNTARTLLIGLSLALGLLATSCSSTRGSAGMPGARRGPVAFPEGSTLRVTEDTSFKRGTYLRPAQGDDGRQGAILLEDLDGVTIDLSQVELRGAPAGTDLAQCAGWGIVIRGCTDVTIRGGTIGGYKACIVVDNSSGVTIDGVQFDGWYGQRLQSTVTVENGADWLWPHENDRAEWLVNYGAAISVTRGRDIKIRNCKGRHGQNGILLARTDAAEIFDNDFSFLSGWGLAMFRSSENKISHNAFDYCVRGYSHDVYWRGQDAAGILMYERSSNNVVAHNSATHCGDGISVFGGNDIVGGRAVERGETDVGGSDGNLFYDNDLSFAVGSSLKVMFSAHNVAIKNRLSGSHQFGVQGAYSSNLLLFGNEIHGTLGSGVSIEHGQDCLIAQNSIRDNLKGIDLFWDDDPQYVNGPYGEQRETDSRGHWLLSNTLADNDLDLRMAQTTAVAFANNRFPMENRRLEVLGLEAEGRPDLEELIVREWMSGPDGSRPSGLIRESTLRPWDGRGHPRLEEVRNQRAPIVPGKNKVIAEAGEGALDTIVMGEWGPWDHRSREERPAQRFPGGLLAHAEWDAVWFPWNPATSDPRGDVEAWRALRSKPYLRRTVGNWSSPWPGNDIRKVVGNEYFGVIARTEITLRKSGWYELSVTSDDGMRLSLDGSTVLEDWTWHSAKEQSTTLQLEAGNHWLDLEYFQIYGAGALTVQLEAVDM